MVLVHVGGWPVATTGGLQSRSGSCTYGTPSSRSHDRTAEPAPHEVQRTVPA
jgi:hypothetical protein